MSDKGRRESELGEMIIFADHLANAEEWCAELQRLVDEGELVLERDVPTEVGTMRGWLFRHLEIWHDTRERWRALLRWNRRAVAPFCPCVVLPWEGE